MDNHNYQMLFPRSSSSEAAYSSGFHSLLGLSNNNGKSNAGERSSLNANTDQKPASSCLHNDIIEGTLSGSSSRRDEGDNDIDNTSQKQKKKKKKERKERFAFQTRSQVDILDDGYKWRKYGQKAVKNNRFPRSYYRCTHEGCNVKKQVQRLARDEGVVVTTYEGVHTHPVDKPSDNFHHILTQMHIYTPF